MSVVALLKGNGVDSSMAVATEIAFEQVWLPPSEELGLSWIPLFQSGLDIRPEDWDDIAHELRRLKSWALTKGDDETREYLVERIDRLLNEIPTFLDAPDGEVWIG
jgi:hypothetical protein